MLVVGVDPDTKNTGITILSGDETVFAVASAKGKYAEDRFHQMGRAILDVLSRPARIDVLVVEKPRIYPNSKVRPRDIMNLKAVFGMIIAAGNGATKLVMPEPREWRGTIAKGIVQSRILDRWSPDLSSLPAAARSHVIDSLGIAHWGRDGSYLGKKS